MLAKILSGAVHGLDGHLVEVELALARGLPVTVMVGRPDSGCQESCDRVRAALVNSGFDFPLGRVTINLAPALMKKAGAQFDLPIALGILVASGQLNFKQEKFIAIGELALDGRLRPVRGVLPMCLAAQASGVKIIILSPENAPEAALVEDLQIVAARHLREVIDFLTNPGEMEFYKRVAPPAAAAGGGTDLSEVVGQNLAKRALTIAAAGGHNLLMVGPPGSGKTMMARVLPSIMPELSREEALEVTQIYSAAGHLNQKKFLITERPFRAPHHTASDAGIIGGGAQPRPGEVTLAHRGILFLDELAEFRRSTLEVLRQPLEDGYVTISRAAESFTFPTKFLLIAAANFCPCGFLGDASDRCRCSIGMIQKYWGKISGPLLDRIDLQIEVPRLKKEEIILGGGSSRQAGNVTDKAVPPPGPTSAEIKSLVQKARALQENRYGQAGLLNGSIKGREIKKYIQLDESSERILKQAAAKFFLSYRAIEKIIKVSRTIADLENSEEILTPHLTEALNYRLSKNYF